jgi:hypothetical protein
MRRQSVEVSTEPSFVKLDLSDLADYQRWSKGVCEPFLKDLRQAILTNRPENIAEFVGAWAIAAATNQPPPKCWLAGEQEAASAAEAAMLMGQLEEHSNQSMALSQEGGLGISMGMGIGMGMVSHDDSVGF